MPFPLKIYIFVVLKLISSIKINIQSSKIYRKNIRTVDYIINYIYFIMYKSSGYKNGVEKRK